MTELDFDELDKAVNSLMSNVDASKRNPALDDPKDNVITLDSSAEPMPIESIPTVVQPAVEPKNSSPVVSDSADPVSPVVEPEQKSEIIETPNYTYTADAPNTPETPEGNQPDQSSEPTPTPATDPTHKDTPEVDEPTPGVDTPRSIPANPGSLAVKRRGQFMDMIHPSSDMKTSATQSAKRHKNIIMPTAPKADLAKLNEVMPSNASSLPESTEAEPSYNNADISGVATFPGAESSTSSYATNEDGEPGDKTPLTTPFLADTKPEKRPLGVAASEVPAVEVKNTTDIAPEDQTTPVVPQHLPEELRADILAVESNGLVNASAPVIKAESLNTEDHTISERDEADMAEKAVEENVGHNLRGQLAKTATVAMSSGSIPQQYSESPSTGDQSSGSIYDTDNYHQPIVDAKATKKKSHALKWVLGSISLLVLGGAAGVGYFFLTH